MPPAPARVASRAIFTRLPIPTEKKEKKNKKSGGSNSDGGGTVAAAPLPGGGRSRKMGNWRKSGRGTDDFSSK